MNIENTEITNHSLNLDIRGEFKEMSPRRKTKMAIDWDDMLGGSFIKLINGEAKKMRLVDWRPQVNFKDEKTGEPKAGLIFDVVLEDDKPTNKTWTCTAIKALAKLRPLIEKADAAGVGEINVSVVRVGEGRGTQYDIKEVQ